MTSTGRHTVLFCLLALLGTRTSLAAAPGCATVVEIDPAVEDRWPGVPARVSGALQGHADVDPCARIAIRLDRGTMALEVLLADGRTASRSLSREDDVAPTLEALLLLPPAVRPPPAEAPAAVATPPAATARPASFGTTTIAGWSAGPAPSPVPRVRLEFSLATGARVGDGQKGFAVDALTLFDLRGWLVGFEAGVVHYEVDGDNVVADSLEAGVLVGRRLRFARVALDLMLGPAVAVRGLGNDIAVAHATGAQGSSSPPPVSDGPWARLLVGSRVTFRLPSLVRPFVGVDADVALRRSSIAATSGERQLPAWVVGLVLGVTVGTP